MQTAFNVHFFLFVTAFSPRAFCGHAGAEPVGDSDGTSLPEASHQG